jgi:Fe-S-cluster-containing dehydrogenase component
MDFKDNIFYKYREKMEECIGIRRCLLECPHWADSLNFRASRHMDPKTFFRFVLGRSSPIRPP